MRKVFFFSGYKSHAGTGSLYPAAIEGAAAGTKSLESSVKWVAIGDLASTQAVTQVGRRSPETFNAGADPSSVDGSLPASRARRRISNDARSGGCSRISVTNFRKLATMLGSGNQFAAAHVLRHHTHQLQNFLARSASQIAKMPAQARHFPFP